MEFYTITQEFNLNNIADAIVGREAEIYSYEMNITNYQIMLDSLPQGDWPVELEQYRFARLTEVPDELDSLVSSYQYRDYLRGLIRTEKLERDKSVRIYEALVSRIPEADRSALIMAAHARAFPNANTST